jgi:RNA polymerase sigma-70 factor (ECF subfamily)
MVPSGTNHFSTANTSMCANDIRIHQLNAEEQVPDSTPEEMLEYKELEEVINRTLKKLPQRRQAIFRMHRLEGLKYKEIADTLSLSVKTIEAEMTKTYQELRREIEKYTYVL